MTEIPSDGDFDFVLDASEGGYFLCSFPRDSDGRVLGDVLAQAPADEAAQEAETDVAVVVNSLGGVDSDSRVLLQVTLWSSEEEVPMRPSQLPGTPDWDRGYRFTVRAPDGLLVISFDTAEQYEITSRPGTYKCQVAMRVRDPIESGLPHEQHILYIWPDETSDDNYRWWARA